MCLIVDNNIVRRVLIVQNDPDFGEISRALFTGQPYPARLVYERRLRAEYETNTEVSFQFLVLVRAQRAILAPDAPIQAEMDALQESGLCKSNDLHILALARVTGVRLLCSLDQPLHTDFTNAALLSKPRGKVYQNASHSHLLRRACKPADTPD